MKKVFLILLGLVAVSCAEPKDNVKKENSGIDGIYTYTEQVNGMTYKYNHTTHGGITVVNLTKDSLEMEYMKSQITINHKFYGE